MTKKQIEHTHALAEEWTALMADKYEAGAREHGGNIWEMSELDLLHEAMMENIDQFVYLSTLRAKMERREMEGE